MAATRSSAEAVSVPRMTVEHVRRAIGAMLMQQEELLDTGTRTPDELLAIGAIILDLTRLDGELEDLAM